MITFSNPRLEAVFEDWPIGGNKRGRCQFKVENGGKKGFRISRTTTGKPKYSTYANQCAIVDGSNGKTYLLQRLDISNSVHVMRSDFMDASGDLERTSSSFYQDNDIYNTLRTLIDQANA
jgi:hypothetical protein